MELSCDVFHEASACFKNFRGKRSVLRVYVHITNDGNRERRQSICDEMVVFHVEVLHDF